MAIKITWLQLFTGILLSLLTSFTYCFIPTSLFPDTPNLIYLLLEIGFSISHCWEAHQPLSLAVILQSSHLLRILPAIILFCWDLVFFFHLFCLLFCLMSVYYRKVVWVKSETPSNVAWAYPALGWMTRHSVTKDIGIVRTDLKLWGLGMKIRLKGIPNG